MTGRPLRVTPAIREVMTAILDAPPDKPPWGFSLCEATGRGSGSVYPALDKLMQAGWVTARWEDQPPADRPRRRLYTASYYPDWYKSRLGE